MIRPLRLGFRVLGGVPRRGIYDNMRTAVDKIGRGKARQDLARCSAMASHFPFEPQFCNPAVGWEKGLVEKTWRMSVIGFFKSMLHANSLEELNLWLDQRCQTLGEETSHRVELGTIAEAWRVESQFLSAAPRPVDGFTAIPDQFSAAINRSRLP